MDEFIAAIKARGLVDRINVSTIPVPTEPFLQHFDCKLKVDGDLDADESGYSVTIRDAYVIVVNGKDSDRRQRFTIFHEIAHIDLGLPSEHAGGPSWSYNNRPPNEICCDVYAAEMLLPHNVFKPLVDQASIGFDTLESLAARFDASLMATGSRLATTANIPCAFVVSEKGRIKYTVRSKELRESRAWITPGTNLPPRSLSVRIRSGQPITDTEEIAADYWFENWRKGGMLLEEGRYLSKYDQTLTLLWFEDEEVPLETETYIEEEDMGLKELDGILPWPGKRKRR